MDNASGYKTGFFTNCKTLVPVEKIKTNDFTIPDDDLIPDHKKNCQKGCCASSR